MLPRRSPSTRPPSWSVPQASSASIDPTSPPSFGRRGRPCPESFRDRLPGPDDRHLRLAYLTGRTRSEAHGSVVQGLMAYLHAERGHRPHPGRFVGRTPDAGPSIGPVCSRSGEPHPCQRSGSPRPTGAPAPTTPDGIRSRQSGDAGMSHASFTAPAVTCPRLGLAGRSHPAPAFQASPTRGPATVASRGDNAWPDASPRR